MTYNKDTKQKIEFLRSQAKDLELSSGARLRLSWFAYAFDHEGNISLTCTHFGISRSTYHRWSERFDPTDPGTLEDRSKRPKRVRREETAPEVIELIRGYRQIKPTAEKNAISQALLREHGLSVSPSTVGRVIARHGFFFGDSDSHRLKRAIHESAVHLRAGALERGSLTAAEDELPGIYAS